MNYIVIYTFGNQYEYGFFISDIGSLINIIGIIDT